MTPSVNTRYYSGVFRLPGQGVSYQQLTDAFASYLAGKYGVQGSPFCHGERDENKVRSSAQSEIAQLKHANWKITETGWTYAVPGQTAAAQAPSVANGPAPQGWSYFCTAGYHNNTDPRFYLTGMHPLSVRHPELVPMADDTAPVSSAWSQAMKQRDPSTVDYCVFDRTMTLQSRRQQILANKNLRIVDVDWEYGQGAPAAAGDAQAAAAASAQAAPSQPASTATQAVQNAASDAANAAARKLKQLLHH